MSRAGNRKHLILFLDAPTLEDAELLAPDWAEYFVEAENGWMCFESEPAADVWEGRN
jgi:hypothetical protein